MRELTKNEIEILSRHAKWLGGNGGERANLIGAYLHRADLSSADLRYADLDFSSWPLRCGSTGIIAGDRLFAQLLFHLTRIDVSKCSGGVKEAMQHIRNMAAADLFCEYRDDVKTIADDERFANDCK